jgi:hypothetical protein
MLLGNPGSAWRCFLVWSVATVGAVLVVVETATVASPTWSAVHSGTLDALPLDGALSGLAATVLLACAAWAWIATTATVLAAARGVQSGAVWRLPTGVRRMVLTACGVALVGGLTSPALATGSGHGRHGLVGLPLPDRATISPRHRPEADSGRPRAGPGSSVVVVEAGDSLWSIAAADLPVGASDARITARWHAVYAANHSVIGSDPDLLEPGQRLRLPGEDAS